MEVSLLLLGRMTTSTFLYLAALDFAKLSQREEIPSLFFFLLLFRGPGEAGGLCKKVDVHGGGLLTPRVGPRVIRLIHGWTRDYDRDVTSSSNCARYEQRKNGGKIWQSSDDDIW